MRHLPRGDQQAKLEVLGPGREAGEVGVGHRRQVPRGRVATYGQIASLAGLEGQARQVGYAMAAVPSSSAVPWHRVINAQGRVSMRSEGPGGTIIQQQLLEREGFVFDAGGRVALARFGWKPRRR